MFGEIGWEGSGLVNVGEMFGESSVIGVDGVILPPGLDLSNVTNCYGMFERWSTPLDWDVVYIGENILSLRLVNCSSYGSLFYNMCRQHWKDDPAVGDIGTFVLDIGFLSSVRRRLG